MKIGIIDSNRNSYVAVPDIERTMFGDAATVSLYRATTAQDLPDEILDCDGLISWHLVALDASFLGKLKKCRGIVRAAVGFDNIDLDAANERNIPVANVPDYGTQEVADHTLAMTLSLLRKIGVGHQVVTSGSWDWRRVGPIPRISELHVGLVGCGRIGSAVALRFKALGCRVTIFDPYLPSGIEKSLQVGRVEALHALLNTVDVVSIHAPLTKETRHLVGASELQMLKGKYLVNTARGPIVDCNALCHSVLSGAIEGVALDVFEDEKEPVPEALRTRPEVLLSPHVAFYSQAALPELRAKAVTVLSSLLQHGSHRNTV